MKMCDNCKQRPAILNIKQKDNNTVKELFICSECAKKMNISIVSAINMDNFISHMMPYENDELEERKKCKKCGATIADLKKTGRVGCGECYKVFAKPLETVINKLHGNNRHLVNKNVKNIKNPEELKENSKTAALKRELKQAIEKEEYEQAAIIRDKIKDMEGKDE